MKRLLVLAVNLEAGNQEKLTDLLISSYDLLIWTWTCGSSTVTQKKKKNPAASSAPFKSS